MFVVLGSAEKFQLSMEANHQNYIYILALILILNLWSLWIWIFDLLDITNYVKNPDNTFCFL